MSSKRKVIKLKFKDGTFSKSFHTPSSLYSIIKKFVNEQISTVNIVCEETGKSLPLRGTATFKSKKGLCADLLDVTVHKNKDWKPIIFSKAYMALMHIKYAYSLGETNEDFKHYKIFDGRINSINTNTNIPLIPSGYMSSCWQEEYGSEIHKLLRFKYIDRKYDDIQTYTGRLSSGAHTPYKFFITTKGENYLEKIKNRKTTYPLPKNHGIGQFVSVLAYILSNNEEINYDSKNFLQVYIGGEVVVNYSKVLQILRNPVLVKTLLFNDLVVLNNDKYSLTKKGQKFIDSKALNLIALFKKFYLNQQSGDLYRSLINSFSKKIIPVISTDQIVLNVLDKQTQI